MTPFKKIMRKGCLGASCVMVLGIIALVIRLNTWFGCNLAYAPMTLRLAKADGANIPIQNERPMISFEPQERPTLSLAGEWKKKRSDVDHVLSLSPRNASWFKKIEAESAGAFESDFDDSSWQPHQVPGVENAMPVGPDSASGAELYDEGIYYRRRVDIPSEWQGRTVRLVCLAADYVADVWVNGQWVGTHEGGYTPFALDLSRVLLYGGANVFFFRIDAMEWKLRQDIVPTYFATDWMHYVGLVQDVYLEAAPVINIVRTDVVPQDAEGNLDVSVLVENDSEEEPQLEVRFKAFEMDASHPGYLTDPVSAHLVGAPCDLQGESGARLSVKKGTFTRKSFRIQIPNPKPWSPAEPRLYVMKVELSSEGVLRDSFATQFGVRKVEVGKGGKILLNGRPVFFPGMARHEDWPDSGRTATLSKIIQDLEIIRGTNVRLLRAGHYPNHPYTYLMTDRMGLAVWAEIPTWWINTISINKLTRRGLPKQMFRELCWNQRNNPSILLWSVGNEPMYYLLTTGKLKSYVKDLHEDLDTNYPDGRLVTMSLAADGVKVTGGSVDDLDVAGFTLYYGVFYGEDATSETKAFLEEQHRLRPDKPIIACEFGTWPGLRDQGEQDQVMIAERTLDGMLPLAAVDAQGQETAGFLASTVWWCQFNWYRVDRKAPVQNMGITRMDRVTHKAVREALAQRFKPYYDMGGLAN